MKTLVTGAAGYVGSTVALALLDAGDQPVGLDDLSAGDPQFLRHFPSYVGDAGDPAMLDLVFAREPDIGAVIHCAARTVVPESMAEPALYYRNNVAKTLTLVEAALAHGCTRFVFSSSAAVYGTTQSPVVSEDSPITPASPYARSKAMVETMLTDVSAATPLSALSLRYFNPIGCDPCLRSGPWHPAPTNVFGSLLTSWRAGTPFRIHGDDWGSADGTPLRDFVHVWDLATAHVAALHRWPVSASVHEVVNLGSGAGTTIRQLVDVFNRHVDEPVCVEYDARRPGDTLGCSASIAKAAELLGWLPRFAVADAVADALRWASRDRDGAVAPARVFAAP